MISSKETVVTDHIIRNIPFTVPVGKWMQKLKNSYRHYFFIGKHKRTLRELAIIRSYW